MYHNDLELTPTIKRLETINKKMAELTAEKEELTDFIINKLGHKKEGQQTHEYGIYKLEIRTPYIYSFDKVSYLSSDVLIPAEYNPIKESISYSVDKKLYNQFITLAPVEVKKSLKKLVTIKPGKESITIKYK